MIHQKVNGKLYYLFHTAREARAYSWLFGRKVKQVGRLFGFEDTP